MGHSVNLKERLAKYDPKEWSEEDIALHKSIDWSARNYEDYEVADDTFIDTAKKYNYGSAPEEKKVVFHKFLRANPIYPPYYAPARNPFDGGIGPMYDGHVHGLYGVHDRYEDVETYTRLSEAIQGKKRMTSLKESIDEDEIVYYVFPELNGEDIVEARAYGLKELKGYGEADETVLSGRYEDLKYYADNYLAYDLVNGYLFDENGDNIDLDESLKEGAEGKRDPNWEYVIIDVTDDEQAPVVGKRSTKVEADYAQIKGLNKKKFENRDLVVHKVPKGMFKIGDTYDTVHWDDEYFEESLSECVNMKESVLRESRWEYEVDKNLALSLREAIKDDDALATCSFIQLIYDDIYEKINDEDIFSEDELERYKEDIDWLDLDADDADEAVNYELDNLYDFCDNLNIWIPINESLTEADALHPVIKKDIKNAYKRWDRRNDENNLKRDDYRKIATRVGEDESTIDRDLDLLFPPKKPFKYDLDDSYNGSLGLEKHDFPFYVTYYEEYPIYEPAEGGYYYAGVQANSSWGFNSKDEALEFLEEAVKENEGDWEKMSDGYIERSKYIGENRYFVVEPRNSYLSKERGWHPYS